MWAMFIRLIRYGLVGLAVNLAGYLVYLLVTWVGVGPKMTVTALYGTGATLGYFGHRRLSFNHGGNMLASSLRYGIAHTCGYALNLLLLYVFVDELGYPHQLVQAAAIFVVAAFLFVCFNFLVFPQEQSMRAGRSEPE